MSKKLNSIDPFAELNPGVRSVATMYDQHVQEDTLIVGQVEEEVASTTTETIHGNDSSLSPQAISKAYGEATELLLGRIFTTPQEFMRGNRVPIQKQVRITEPQFNLLETLARLSGLSINIIAINLLNEVLTVKGSLSLNSALKKYIEEKAVAQKKSSLEILR